MLNKHWRCEVCDTPQHSECNCFCDCWLPHNQCVCDMTEEDWNNYHIQSINNRLNNFTTYNWKPMWEQSLDKQVFYIFETFINWNKKDALEMYKIISQTEDGYNEIINQLSVYKKEFQIQFLLYILNSLR